MAVSHPPSTRGLGGRGRRGFTEDSGEVDRGMSEHGSRRGGGGGGSRGRRSANGGGFSDKLDGLTNQLSGMFAKRRGGGGGRRGGDGYDDQYGEYGSYDDRGYG